ncbi:hypothetical protein PR048_000826 [Dryococelus australis]|uniref:Uncharacterized protein n=1 Tax=Dryococelus australis TaxID=614101 RepID=A0ABQ9II28_9NEOP|nr:hypothetical protein PR048_000826 [Dryococelus australis]
MWSSAGMKGQGELKIPVKTFRPAASSGTIPTCENLAPVWFISRFEIKSELELRSTQKTVAPFDFRAWLEIEMNFISNRRICWCDVLSQGEKGTNVNVILWTLTVCIQFSLRLRATQQQVLEMCEQAIVAFIVLSRLSRPPSNSKWDGEAAPGIELGTSGRGGYHAVHGTTKANVAVLIRAKSCEQFIRSGPCPNPREEEESLAERKIFFLVGRRILVSHSGYPIPAGLAPISMRNHGRRRLGGIRRGHTQSPALIPELFFAIAFSLRLGALMRLVGPHIFRHVVQSGSGGKMASRRETYVVGSDTASSLTWESGEEVAPREDHWVFRVNGGFQTEAGGAQERHSSTSSFVFWPSSARILYGTVRVKKIDYIHAASVPSDIYARLHHRGSKLDPRSDLRLSQKTIAPFYNVGLHIQGKQSVNGCIIGVKLDPYWTKFVPFERPFSFWRDVHIDYVEQCGGQCAALRSVLGRLRLVSRGVTSSKLGIPLIALPPWYSRRAGLRGVRTDVYFTASPLPFINHRVNILTRIAAIWSSNVYRRSFIEMRDNRSDPKQRFPGKLSRDVKFKDLDTVQCVQLSYLTLLFGVRRNRSDARLHHRGSKLDPKSDLRSTQNHEISLVQHFYIGTKIKLDPGSELGSFDLGSGKMLVQLGLSSADILPVIETYFLVTLFVLETRSYRKYGDVPYFALAELSSVFHYLGLPKSVRKLSLIGELMKPLHGALELDVNQ